MFGYALFCLWFSCIFLLFSFWVQFTMVTRPVRKLLFPLIPRYVKDGEFGITYCETCGRRLMVEYELLREKYDPLTGKRKEREIQYKVGCDWCSWEGATYHAARKEKG